MVAADYVVVGAGSAGCAVARRLAESGASVVVLEAGGSDTAFGVRNLIEIPGAVAVMLSTPQLKKLVDWGYKSVPQTAALGRVMPQPRGKVLGGSSSVNGMLFVRGNRRNFDDWAADGAPGWSYDEVLPAFKRMEDWEDGGDEVRGAGGPVKVRRQRDLTPASQSFLDSAPDRLGVRRLDDYNGAEQEGIGVMQLSADAGARYSSSRAYLRADPPENLLVLTRARATRVVLAGSRAVGVEVVGADGERQVIRADREVIVSAGAFDSPKLLMLSGIGPAAHLRQHGIETVSDLPVGENLHDHLFVPVGFQMKSALRRPTPAYFMRGLARARLRRSGWATGAQFEVTGFVRSSGAKSVPDLQLLALYWLYPFPNQDNEGAVRPPTTKPGLSVFPALIYPESRGTVRLAGSDPMLAPLIDPAYLQADKDAEVLLEGIAMVREAMAGVGDSTGEIVPGPAYSDPAELRRILPNIVHTEYHPVGTCRMGSDERAVVDPQLRVRGIEGLRVADASIMPTVTGGNTNAPSMMIGERCAEFVLAGA
ncbi:GMC family oxidoreductase N-terminal domain-containing protein [Mycolicibacterium setense]|nr:GMC family oxidoreductase N-terminal domain-containing protein [Mycolicibacterium setense]KHO25328.1 choline dehydrogenase [Mycolicibacterium setense]MCV7109771.1 GMC family oxidoreductase N-terminal domain-containing protein [Mycolicibacterium setense]